MRLRFWGTRGSLPVSLTSEGVQRKLAAVIEWARRHPDDDVSALLARARGELGFAATSTYGGHSACVELDAGEGPFVVCDLGSGARALGVSLEDRAAGGSRPRVVNVFMSHLHWDHIMGLPFFGPAYDPRWIVRIHGGHAQLEAALRRQQDEPSFPVPFDAMGARIEFVVLDPERAHAVDGFEVRLRRQRHAGGSYGWRFSLGGRSVVYSTDSEHRLEETAEVEGFVEFFRGADVVVFDAMYSLLEAISVKEDWGHSSNVVGVELCQRAGVRHLCLFHHEPAYSDEQIEQVLRETVRFEELTREDRAPLKVSAAADGQEIDL